MVRARRAKLVATLGPATDGLELELVRAGLDIARLNFSHGVAADHRRRCEAIREAARVCGRQIAVMQDLQGPKIRVGSLVGGGPVQLHAGDELTIECDDIVAHTLIDFVHGTLKQELRSCYPRDIVNQICWATKYEGREPQINHRTVMRAIESYFLTKD